MVKCGVYDFCDLWLFFAFWISLNFFFSVPGPVLETTVGEDVKSIVLLNLLSGTEYRVQLTASYPGGQSEPLLVNAKTCKYAQTLL